MGPYGGENFKRPLLLQITVDSSQTFPNGPHKNTLGIFGILKIENSTIFFFVFVSMEPYGSKTFKTLLLQIAAESFQTLPEFSSHGPHQNTFWDFSNFEN